MENFDTLHEYVCHPWQLPRQSVSVPLQAVSMLPAECLPFLLHSFGIWSHVVTRGHTWLTFTSPMANDSEHHLPLVRFLWGVVYSDNQPIISRVSFYC